MRPSIERRPTAGQRRVVDRLVARERRDAAGERGVVGADVLRDRAARRAVRGRRTAPRTAGGRRRPASAPAATPLAARSGCWRTRTSGTSSGSARSTPRRAHAAAAQVLRDGSELVDERRVRGTRLVEIPRRRADRAGRGRAPGRRRTRRTSRPRGRRAPRGALAGRAWRNPEPILHRRKAQPSQACPQQRPLGPPLLGDRVAHERPATVPRSHRTGELERQAPPFGDHPRAPVGHRVRRRAPRPGRHEDAAAGEPGDRRSGAGLSDPELPEQSARATPTGSDRRCAGRTRRSGSAARAGAGTRIGTSEARWLRSSVSTRRARARRPRRRAVPDRSCSSHGRRPALMRGTIVDGSCCAGTPNKSTLRADSARSTVQ